MVTELEKQKIQADAKRMYWATPEDKRPQFLAKVQAALLGGPYHDWAVVAAPVIQYEARIDNAARKADINRTKAVSAMSAEYRPLSASEVFAMARPLLIFGGTLAVGGSAAYLFVSAVVGIGNGIAAAAAAYGGYIFSGVGVLIFIGFLVFALSALRETKTEDAAGGAERKPVREVIQIVRDW